MKVSRAAVVIVANSPGEVTGWALPVVASLRALEHKITTELGELVIVIVLPPCPFSTGYEAKVAALIPGVDAVVTPSEYLKFIMRGSIPERVRHLALEKARETWRGVVVHLGGDHLHSVLIARMLGFPAVAYSDRTIKFQRKFIKVLAEDARVAGKLKEKGVPDGKLEIVGNLMIDGVRLGGDPEGVKDALGIAKDAPMVCLLPGSRKQQIRYVMPFFLRVAEIVKKFCENAEFVMPLSPFVSVESVRSALVASGNRVNKDKDVTKAGEAKEGLEAAFGVLHKPTCSGQEESLAQAVIETEDGVPVFVIPKSRYSVMAASDLALCMPGSVTAELGYLGVPTIVAVPLNLPEEIPLTGIFEFIGRLPLIGRPIKRMAVRRMLGRIEFTAIPNKRQRRFIAPEIRGVLTAEDVAIKVLELLQDTKARDRISVELKEAMGRPGAADSVASSVLGTLITTGGRYFEPAERAH
jgi:lipid A disaccharide synthetase